MESSAKHDERVMKMVSTALHKAPAEREHYLRVACENDPQLYQETIEAVGWEERMGSFLLHPMIAFNDCVRPFQAGQIISERFEIVREIGEGGMGVVYEAFDRKRKQRIAIKAAKPGFQRLLSPELEGALHVRHPNVCLVNEIHTAQTAGGEVDFLTMEFLDGETLSAHLQANGRLNQGEALKIALQLCAGLAEAHRSGIIHRDLKSANVILCRAADGSLRAVITDFGLAGGMTSQSGELAGTPGYMAPELWHGGKASKASDVYSLGVILYEMVTGTRPFRQKSPKSGQVRRPPAPSTLTRGLDPRWDRLVLQCLAVAPAERPPDAARILAGLERKTVGKKLALASALVATVLAFVGLTTSVRESVVDVFWPQSNVRLAVLPLDGSIDSPAIAGVLQDVSERVGHLRSGRRTVVVIPPSQAQSNKVQTPEQAKKALHATHALQIAVHREGDEFVAKGSVLDLTTQTSLRQFSGRYSSTTVGNMPAALTGEVSLALRLRGGATEVLSPAAAVPYDHALYLLRSDRQRIEDATALFKEASALDPLSPLPLAGLVEAEIVKFDITKNHSCLQEAEKFLQSAESLSPDSVRVRLGAGLLNQTVGQYGKALEDYSRVQDLEPRNVDALLRTARVFDELEMPDKAIESFQKAMSLDPGYYQPYHEMGVFYYYRGRYSEAADQFHKSIDRAPRFEEYTNLGAALNELGRDDEAERALLTSLNIRETARALNSMGAIRAYQRRDAEAVSYYARAIAMDPNEFVYVENLADSLRRLKRRQQAKVQYRQAMEMALSNLRENPRLGYPRAFVAYIAARLGERKRAEQEIGQALQLSPGDNKVIRNAVLTYEALGRRDQAIQVLGGATAELLRELDRQPDLAEFRQDLRFQQLVVKNSAGGRQP
jgi:tetratricopeptide (TPR) repeat protein